MDKGTDSIRKLVHDLKSLSFWERLFSWGKVRSLLVDASADLQKLIVGYESLTQATHDLELERNRNKSLETSLAELKIVRSEKEHLLKEKAALESKSENYFRRGIELANELTASKQRIESLQGQLRATMEENTRYKTEEEQRRRNYEQHVSTLNDTMNRIKSERDNDIKARHETELAEHARMKETWSRHEENVQSRIKAICNKHGVEYLSTVPFKGKPDVTLKINSEYVIFDAKSPAGDDQTNFPLYLRAQSESLSKYTKEDDVRREIFLVVPSNTLEHLEQFEFRLVDYTVYIVSIDSLEPIILALRRIEDYEFAEQLSPEERENICRIIGKFVHLSKRRIQIDGFFAKQFFELVYRSEAELPGDILRAVSEFEKAEKLNPPQEKRARQISIKELEADATRIKSDATQQGIYTDESFLMKNLNKLPLYVKDPAKTKALDQQGLFTDDQDPEAKRTGLAR